MEWSRKHLRMHCSCYQFCFASTIFASSHVNPNTEPIYNIIGYIYIEEDLKESFGSYVTRSYGIATWTGLAGVVAPLCVLPMFFLFGMLCGSVRYSLKKKKDGRKL